MSRFAHRAERFFFWEKLALALDMDKDEVVEYITRHVEKSKED